MKTETTTERPTESQRSEALEALGFVLVINHGPKGEVRDNDWPCIAYDVSLDFKGRKILRTDYRLGIGHVDVSKARPDSILQRWADDEYSMVNAWQSKPNAQFNDKALQARVAAKLAIQQKVKPTLADVLHSLLSDGEAYFNAQTFENWAIELGYDPDSRKAEAIWKLCDDIGRKLASGVNPDALKEARAILEDY